MARKTIKWGKDNWNGDAVNVFLEDDGTYTFWRQGEGEKVGLTKDAAIKLYESAVDGPRYNSRVRNDVIKAYPMGDGKSWKLVDSVGDEASATATGTDKQKIKFQLADEAVMFGWHRPEIVIMENSRACNSSNPIVRRAINACGKNAMSNEEFDKKALSAFRQGCRNIIDGMLEKVRRLRTFTTDTNENLSAQSQDFQRWIKEVQDVEKALIGIMGSR